VGKAGTSWPARYACGLTRIEVAWHDGSEWRTLVLPREHAMVADRLLAYARLGLPVDSTMSATVTAYLSAFERANISVIPTGRAAARLGWHGDTFAWPGDALPSVTTRWWCRSRLTPRSWQTA